MPPGASGRSAAAYFQVAADEGLLTVCRGAHRPAQEYRPEQTAPQPAPSRPEPPSAWEMSLPTVLSRSSPAGRRFASQTARSMGPGGRYARGNGMGGSSLIEAYPDTDPFVPGYSRCICSKVREPGSDISSFRHRNDRPFGARACSAPDFRAMATTENLATEINLAPKGLCSHWQESNTSARNFCNLYGKGSRRRANSISSCLGLIDRGASSGRHVRECCGGNLS